MPVITIVPPGAELIIKDSRSPNVTVRSRMMGDRYCNVCAIIDSLFLF
jgi:hypothetical protein